jgi:hypothetical protein
LFNQAGGMMKSRLPHISLYLSALIVAAGLTVAAAAGIAGEVNAETPAAAQTDLPPEAERAPITSAFGVPLGARFSPNLFVKVLRDAEHTYRGEDGSQRKGKRYWVEPKIPNPNFTSYSVATTSEGFIYAIRGEYETADRISKCDGTQTLAAFLEQKYGPPRGRGASDEWYSFRDMSATAGYKGIRLYANRCARGSYTIVYSDDSVRFARPALEVP